MQTAPADGLRAKYRLNRTQASIIYGLDLDLEFCRTYIKSNKLFNGFCSSGQTVLVKKEAEMALWIVKATEIT